MNISSVSFSSSSAYSTVNNSDVSQLEEQKTTLESVLGKVNQSKDDENNIQQLKSENNSGNNVNGKAATDKRSNSTVSGQSSSTNNTIDVWA